MMKAIDMLDLKAEFPLVEEDVRKAIDDVLDSQRFVGGPQVGELEARIAAVLECDHAIAVSSGTDAILLALMACGIGHGDEVITTPFTFFATAGCIHRLGARPVFVDIEPDTFNIDASKIGEAITARTRAILPVHLFGQCADMDAINEIASRGKLIVIEDAAQAIGATRRGRFAGTLGKMGCLSFYPTKNLGCFGEGGMILTGDEGLAARCRKLRNHGQTDRYHHELVGGNFRLDTMKAAILLAKLRHLDEFNARRRRNAAAYDEALSLIPGVNPPVVREQNRSCFHQYSIVCDRRDLLKDHLAAAGIGSAIYYPVPPHLQPCFAGLGYRKGQLPVSERVAEHILSLPVHPLLTVDDVRTVADAVRLFYSDATRRPRRCTPTHSETA